MHVTAGAGGDDCGGVVFFEDLLAAVQDLAGCFGEADAEEAAEAPNWRRKWRGCSLMLWDLRLWQGSW